MSINEIPFTEALYKPIKAILDTQHHINEQTINMIDNYQTIKEFTINTNDNTIKKILIPMLNLVQIPSLNIKKFNVEMNLEDRGDVGVKLSTKNSNSKTYDINMEIGETTQPNGLIKLNNILAELIKIEKVNLV